MGKEYNMERQKASDIIALVVAIGAIAVGITLTGILSLDIFAYVVEG